MSISNRYLIDECYKIFIADWKERLQNPDIAQSDRDRLIKSINDLEENLNYEYSSVHLKHSHIIVIKHKRGTMRPLVLEEKYSFFSWWYKFKIWLNWYWNK